MVLNKGLCFFVFMRRGIFACGGMIVGLVFIVVALLGPWYLVNGSGVLGTDYSVNMFLTHMEAQGTLMGQTISFSMRYADAVNNAESAGIDAGSFTVVNNAMYLTVAACITAVIAVIGMAAFVLQKETQRSMKYLGGGFGMLTFLLTLLPALYFMMTGFSTNNAGFWFSASELGWTITGGPGYAWYLMIVTAIIAVIASLAILLKKQVPEATPVQETVPPEIQ